jgi:hypothetical protein
MTPSLLLSGLRVAVGAGAWASPTLAGRAFGLDTDANPQATYLSRLFGIRDVVLAAGTLGTPAGPTRDLWWKLGIVADAADVGAAVLGIREGRIPTKTGVLAGLTATGAVVLGVLALQAEED